MVTVCTIMHRDSIIKLLNPFTNGTRGILSCMARGGLRCERCVDTITIKCVAQYNKKTLARTQARLTLFCVQNTLTPEGPHEKLGQISKPLPYSWPKSAGFATLFMTWPKFWQPIYDHCGWHSCLKRYEVIDGFIDNYKKVASSSKQSTKTMPIYNQNQWPE